MVRRVKAYLKSMKVITDEEELHRMSQEVEPPSGGQPAPAIPVITTVGLGHAVTLSRGHAVTRSRCHEVTRSRCPAQVRKRNPSPSPSAVSSSSSTPSHYSAPGPEADKRLGGSYLAQAPNKFGE